MPWRVFTDRARRRDGGSSARRARLRSGFFAMTPTGFSPTCLSARCLGWSRHPYGRSLGVGAHPIRTRGSTVERHRHTQAVQAWQACSCRRAHSSTAPRSLSSRQEVFDVRTRFPPGGRQPSSELEEILAQVQQYWQGFRAGPIIGLVALVVALIFLWSSWFTVQPEETGVVQRFGKVVRTAEPGLALQVALRDRDGPPGAHGPRAQGGVRLPDAGQRSRPAHAIYG